MTQPTRFQELSLKNPYFTSNQEPLAPLPYPVYFVTKNLEWQDLIDHPELVNDDRLYARCCESHDIWSAQVYIDLKRRGLDVYLVSKPVPNQICVIPYYNLKGSDLLFKSFVVACQHDTPYPWLCEQQIVLNHLRVFDHTHHFVPHRPQPGLIPRDQSRGATLENLVFKGRAYNLYAPFQAPEFLAQLQELGIRLVMSTEGLQSTFSDWGNYTDADVVIAVRNNTEYDISLKPALKLINAWFAGCPAILSPEPGYQELRESELDYIEVQSPAEAIAALKRLKENPELYLAMIENGFRRAQDYTPDRIAQYWRDLLAGAITTGYEQWLRQSPLQKQIVRPVQYAWRLFAHKRAMRDYQYGIHNGPRILD